MAVGALTKSCAKVSSSRSRSLFHITLTCKAGLSVTHVAPRLQMLDCTSNPDGTITLDTMPDMICWVPPEEGNHLIFAALGAAGLQTTAASPDTEAPALVLLQPAAPSS